ncbi:MAG: hypothetical protein M1820_000902 [Bogoriella megaspora]|nr:MAG: hypothetical protein M1820_000902 [Bogoriella megaspora]
MSAPDDTEPSPFTPVILGLRTLLRSKKHAPNANSCQPSTTPPRQSPPQGRRFATRPACTHTTMQRIKGRFHCHLCGRIPEIGWLYACMQDRRLYPDTATQGSSVQVSSQPLLTPPNSPCKDVTSQDTPQMSPLRQELEEYGFSDSVLKGIEEGEYTEAQTEKLKRQRMNVKTVIATELGLSRSVPSHPELSSSPPRLATTQASSSSNAAQEADDTAASSKSPSAPELDPTRIRLAMQQPCRFQVCHRCRPTFRDRTNVSLTAAVQGELPPVTPQEAAVLPVPDARILRTIGLHQPTDSRQPSQSGSGTEESSGSSFPYSVFDSEMEIDDNGGRNAAGTESAAGIKFSLKQKPSCGLGINLYPVKEDIETPGNVTPVAHRPTDETNTTSDEASYVTTSEDQMVVDDSVVVTEEAAEMHTSDVVHQA